MGRVAKIRLGLWKTAIFLTILLVTLGFFLPVTPVAEDSPLVSFSATRAMTHVHQLAAQPRPWGSPGHVRAQDYLKDTITSLGLPVEVHSTLEKLPPYWPGEPGAITVHNVLTRVEGQGTEGAVLLVAHYDSFPHSPGAGDNGVGVAAVLETLRALRAYGPLSRDVIVLFSDAEELGLLGAQAFVREHRWVQDIACVVNLDGRGNRGPVLLMEVSPSSWVRSFSRGVARPWAYGLTSSLYRGMGGDTDFSVFRQAGFFGYNLTFVHGVSAYHGPGDVPGELDVGLLQQMGEQCLSLVHQLGQKPDLLATTTAQWLTVYFTLPWGGVVAYDARWNLLITGAVLWGLIALWFRQREVGPKEALAACLAFLGTALALVWLVTQLMNLSLPSRFVQDAALSSYLLAAIALKTTFNFYWTYSQWGRVLSPVALGWGVWWAQAVLLLAATWWLPQAHYLLAWPLLALIIAKGVLPLRHRSLGAFTAATVSFFGLWLPIIYLAYIMLTLEQPAVTLAAVLLGSSWWYSGAALSTEADSSP